MLEKDVKNVFDNSPQSDNLLFRLYKKYGLDLDALEEKETKHNFDIIPFAEAEAEILQNAFNRHLTTIETIRLVTEGRLLIEARLKIFREKKPTS